MTVTRQTLAIARSPEQTPTVVTTAAGSDSEQALALLAQVTGPSTRVDPDTAWRRV